MIWMRTIAEWLERPTSNAKVATVLRSSPTSSDSMESATEEAVLNKVHVQRTSLKILHGFHYNCIDCRLMCRNIKITES